jgi:septum formation protein
MSVSRPEPLRRTSERRFERMSADSLNPLIYLASASPRRSALLQQIGIAHEIHPVAIDETPAPGELARDYVQRLARRKAEVLWEQLPHAARRPVLGADTAVVVDEQILGKPGDASEHAAMLQQLSARTHEVLTAVALRYDKGTAVRLSVSRVAVRALQLEEIAAYWRSGEPADKAGGYAIQGLGALFIEHMSGSYSGVVGLPLYETAELLQLIGWSSLTTAARCG